MGLFLNALHLVVFSRYGMRPFWLQVKPRLLHPCLGLWPTATPGKGAL